MKVVDLFCGCGGMSLGFQNAGFEIVAAFDNWDKAIDIYRKNFKHPIFKCDLGDLMDFTEIKNFQPEMIIGGPPCQDFSSAGKRDESLGRSDLTVKFANIVSEVLPKFFVMENVDRIEKSNAYQKAYQIFKNAGYGLTSTVLDASLCGVPQKRKRFFLIGELNGVDNVFEPYLNANLSEESMTVRDYLGDTLGIEHYYRHPRNYNRRGIFSIDEAAPTVRGVNRPLPSGYPGHSGDSAPVSDKIRPLTTVERSYLQTFPQTFIFEGSKTNLEQMIGNAVPVNLAKYVALSLKDYMCNKKVNDNFFQMNIFDYNLESTQS
ncbi:DNA (cytosine-5-)-methyltransferase [Bacillus cereus]|uniref:DNA cytosine methyltransferase n=1 Tax=Bacillus cereus TaxID=1396 RepID=UPI000985056E|nr:DNA (cytosine-5-)-methyltransferase [Bacillus cereus]